MRHLKFIAIAAVVVWFAVHLAPGAASPSTTGGRSFRRLMQIPRRQHPKRGKICNRHSFTRLRLPRLQAAPAIT
jgi:hypothetical protein